MKWQENSRISLVLVVAVVVHMISVEKAIADYVFGKAVNLGRVVNSPYNDGYGGASVSADGLALYFDSERPGGVGSRDIWVTTRATVSDPWGPPVNLGATVNSASNEECPFISFDGLSLYFSSFRRPCLGGQYGGDLWVTTRATPSDPWGPPVHLDPPVNSSYDESCPCVSADGLLLLFSGNRPDTYRYWDLYQCTRPTPQSAWGPPVHLGAPISTMDSDYNPCMSADGRVLFFTRMRLGPTGSWVSDIWMATRTSTSGNWSTPLKLGANVNITQDLWSAALSADGSILYGASNPPGRVGDCDLWQLPIIRLVDFNSDEIVDISDLVTLIEHWGTNETLCDIGPMPWGDGVVDAADLEVLMSHWQQQVLPVSLIAYWKLDEALGVTATDNAGNYDGTLVGNPTWQPAGGKVAGALQFDGVDDYITAPFVLDPSKPPFSVFLWVKGGAPGQVILSQDKGANWLAVSAGGTLECQLKSPGRNSRVLSSQATITDGEWHHVGFVWDGSNRILYVDDVEAARDAQTSLLGSVGTLYIGTTPAITPGTLWSGLIDDVRIYDRAVKP